MNYQLAKPSILLSQYVKQYWAIDNCISSGSDHIQRIVPNGLMDLVFYLCNKPKSLDEKKLFLENTVLSGQQKGFYDIVISGNLSMFSISFQPYGARFFFDIPSNELFDQNIPLKYLIKDKADELECRLYESKSFEEKVLIVENFLLNQLQKVSKGYEKNRIINSIALIDQNCGLINIETIASFACLSRKQYERTFADYIGSSPKQFLRTVRFQNTLREKQKNRNINLTELAYNCGFFDQSHMINEFKLISGKTPTHYFEDCEPCSDYFQ